MSDSSSRRQFLKIAGVAVSFLLLGCSALSSTQSPNRHSKPNILFILADDLGWMDTSVYGSKYYQTPNIDRLAEKGMLFTDAYSASPFCSPTRASFLVGKYPSGKDINFTVADGHYPPLPKGTPRMPLRGRVNRKMITPTCSRYIKKTEYTYGNAFHDAGYKTGLIGKWHVGRNPEHWAKEYGFDVDMGAPVPGPRSYFAPYKMENFPEGPEGEYVAERVTKEALKFIDEYKNEPFMLSVWHFSVHAPFQAKEEKTQKYRGKEDPRGKQDCAVMASMVESLDDSVGQLMDKLESLNLADHTIIMFMSDNGGNMYDLVEVTTPTNNSPLRGGKGNIYEGGTRCPCIVVWPGIVKPSSSSDEVISSIDFYPTMLEMAGITPNPQQRLEGESFVPVLKGTGALKGRPIFCHFPHYLAVTQSLPATYVRKGDYKLIRTYGEGENRSNAYELYNLKDDISETRNLAKKYPDKVKELDTLIDGFMKDTGSAEPVKNPAYIPTEKGWKPSEGGKVSVEDGLLVFESNSNDPYLYTKEVPIVANQMKLTFKMRTNIQGVGRIYFADGKYKNFTEANAKSFEYDSDMSWKEYEVIFNPRPELIALRIDVGNSGGRAEFESISLSRVCGEPLKKWDLGDEESSVYESPQ